ncbi:hypothetical protein SAMN05216238_11281 [Lentibacillus persicus]|uniref:ABC-2 type transport system permease protein n=1 Tax=Lentibacillus persicus TaxID=640948 RepID=A0A1I1ZJR3_9BACI|nr:hypothetical protein [Lentibacillus persicus]SFE30570.1 hypothetical protein SAMN05216238_11281 [Lentibacillus persicus]
MGRQIKGLLYFYGSDLRYSLTIFWTILLSILVVSLAFTYFLAGLDNDVTLFTFSLTGPMYVYCAILGFLTVKDSVPFLIKMSATRKNIFIGSGVFFLMLALAMSLAATGLQEIVMALMNATGIDFFSFLHPSYFLNDTWYTRVIADTAIMFFFLAVMFMIGLLFYKYGIAGGGSFLGVLLLIGLLGIAQGWLIDFFIDVFTGIDLVFFYQLLGIGLVIYGISFLFLRRITTVKVK